MKVRKTEYARITGKPSQQMTFIMQELAEAMERKNVKNKNESSKP